MNRRGLVQDIAFWAIVMFIIGIMVIVGGKINTEFGEHYQNSTSASAEGKAIQSQAEGRYHVIWDNSFLFVFIVLGIAITISLYYLTSTPALFFVGVILLAIVMIPIAMIGNAFETFESESTVAAESTQLPITVWLMTHILEITIGIGFLGLVLLFGRAGGGYT